MTRPVITVDETQPGTCSVCGAKVTVRTIHLGPSIEVRTCPLCRLALRTALVQTAGTSRDALRTGAMAGLETEEPWT